MSFWIFLSSQNESKSLEQLQETGPTKVYTKKYRLCNYGEKISGDSENITESFSIEVPIIYANEETGQINWDATVAMSSSSTREGRFVIQNIGGRDSIVAVDDGTAGYFKLGVMGRRLVLNDYIEAVVKADYSLRTGGSTEYSRYSRKTGLMYDPEGGVNVGVGGIL